MELREKSVTLQSKDQNDTTMGKYLDPKAEPDELLIAEITGLTIEVINSL